MKPLIDGHNLSAPSSTPGSDTLCPRAGRNSGEQIEEVMMAEEIKKKTPLENAPSKKPRKESGTGRGNAPEKPKKK